MSSYVLVLSIDPRWVNNSPLWVIALLFRLCEVRVRCTYAWVEGSCFVMSKIHDLFKVLWGHAMTRGSDVTESKITGVKMHDYVFSVSLF